MKNLNFSPGFYSKLLFLLTNLACSYATGQPVDDANRYGELRGRLVDEVNGSPIAGAQLMIPSLKQLVASGAEGYFSFVNISYGHYSIVVSAPGIITDTVMFVLHDSVLNLNSIAVRADGSQPFVAQTNTMSLIEAIDQENAGDDGIKNQQIGGLLSASRDPFSGTVAYALAPYRFRARGFEGGNEEVLINGSAMADARSGEGSPAQWAGLNDVFRNRSGTTGLAPSDYAFGEMNGTTYLDASAASQKKQTRVSYSMSDRSYRNRISVMNSSGRMRSGWAYAVAASKRWAQEGYFQGSFYDGYSFYAAASRTLKGGRHEFNLVAFGASTTRGKSAAVTEEAESIAGNNTYNPDWGYQDGRKRNAKVAAQFLPTGILSYEYKPGNGFRWETALSFQSGKTRNSALDYYNADNPSPDYYNKLPGYYAQNGLDPASAPFNKQKQIDWDELYNENKINYDSVQNVNGIAGNTVRGRQSLYVLYDDVEESRRLNFNSNFGKVLGAHATLNGGVTVLWQRTESYRQLSDLLGGDFYLNLNQFAFGQNMPNAGFNQYDLNIPNRVIREGDKYEYDYIGRFLKTFAWLQAVFSYNKLDFFLAGRIGDDAFSREGLYKNGLFSDASFGKSPLQQFTSYSAKGGLTYKLDGRNFLVLDAIYRSDPPGFDDVFISPGSRNLTISAPANQTTRDIEAGYLMHSSRCYLRAMGYDRDVNDATWIKRYYNDDPAFKSFINYVMQGVSTRSIGIELAAELTLTPTLSVSAVTAIGQSFYSNSPATVQVYQDNDTSRIPVSRQVYIKDYYLGVGPQSAYTLGASYRSKKYWFAGLNMSYLDRNYVAISPDQRSAGAIEGVVAGSQQYHAILDQQMLPPLFVMDVSGGTSLLLSKYFKWLPRNVFAYLNAGVSNLLDKRYRSEGFEQLRFDFVNSNPDKFPPKYFYGLGRTFFISLSIKL